MSASPSDIFFRCRRMRALSAISSVRERIVPAARNSARSLWSSGVIRCHPSTSTRVAWDTAKGLEKDLCSQPFIGWLCGVNHNIAVQQSHDSRPGSMRSARWSCCQMTGSSMPEIPPREAMRLRAAKASCLREESCSLSSDAEPSDSTKSSKPVSKCSSRAARGGGNWLKRRSIRSAMALMF